VCAVHCPTQVRRCRASGRFFADPYFGRVVGGVVAVAEPGRAAADRDAARVDAWAIRSCAPAKVVLGWRVSFALPGAGSGTG
jgi:hypothetical protein